MHYQEQSECQADDDYFNNNLQNLLTGSSFQGSVYYTGGCQPESADRALAGGTCYEPVESGSNYWDSYPSSSAPDAGGSDTSWPSPSAEASPSPEPSPSGRRLSESYSDPYYSQYPGFAPPPPSTLKPKCGCEEMDVAFCNYDYGDFGYCESCDDVSTSPCDQRGLPDAGVADCEACCNVSHPYPHPRPTVADPNPHLNSDPNPNPNPDPNPN